MVEWHNWIKVSSVKSTHFFYLLWHVLSLWSCSLDQFVWKRMFTDLKKKRIFTYEYAKYFCLFCRCFTKSLVKTRKTEKKKNLTGYLPFHHQKSKFNTLILTCSKSRMLQLHGLRETHRTNSKGNNDWAFLTLETLQYKCWQATSDFPTYCEVPKPLIN